VDPGTDGNPIVGLAAEVGAKTVETDFYNVVLFDDQGEVHAGDAQAAFETWGEILEEIEALSENAGDSASLADGLAEVADVNDRLIAWNVRSSVVAEYAADPEDLPSSPAGRRTRTRAGPTAFSPSPRAPRTCTHSPNR
jgi:polyamine oxidase